MKLFSGCLVAVLVVVHGLPAYGANQIYFSQSNYTVPAGSILNVDIMISSDPPISIAGTDVDVILGDGGSTIGGSGTAPPSPHFTDLHVEGAGVFIDPDEETSLELFPLVEARVCSVNVSNNLLRGEWTIGDGNHRSFGAAPGIYTSTLARESLEISSDILNYQGASIPVSLGFATITVPGGGCAHAVPPLEVVLPGAESTGAFTVATTDPTCSWTAVSNAPWINLIGPVSGQGTTQIAYSVEQNSGSFRNGTITAGGQDFIIHEENCNFRVIPTSVSIPSVETSGNFSSERRPVVSMDGQIRRRLDSVDRRNQRGGL